MRKYTILLTGLILAWTIFLVGCGVKQNTHRVVVEIEGQGAVNPETEAAYLENTVLDIEAKPAPGWQFARWVGEVDKPYAAKSTLLVDQSKTVQAIFVKSPDMIRQTAGGLITHRADGSSVVERPRGKSDIHYIMLHAISDAVANPTAPYQIERIRAIFDEYSIESHYAIDREGVVYQFVPDEQVARHGGQGAWQGEPRLINTANQYALGIELLGIGTAEEMDEVIGPEANARIKDEDRGYTDAQYRSLNLLLHQLTVSYGISKENIITHRDYAPGRKWDPGTLFDWTRLELE